jgi:large subunit ribosomal protein L27
MAKKKAGGSTRLGRDSNPQYLGPKVGDGQTVKTGMVLIRQRGTKIHPGKNVKRGSDDTIYAMMDGVVKFTRRKRRRFDGSLRPAKYINILPKVEAAAKKAVVPKKTKTTTEDAAPKVAEQKTDK